MVAVEPETALVAAVDGGDEGPVQMAGEVVAELLEEEQAEGGVGALALAHGASVGVPEVMGVQEDA